MPNGDNFFTPIFNFVEKYGANAIKNTFNKAFERFNGDYQMLTELVIALNWKIWEHYECGNEAYATLYNDLWETADAFACDNLKGEEAEYFFEMTD